MVTVWCPISGIFWLKKQAPWFSSGLAAGAGRQLLASYANRELSRNFSQLGKTLAAAVLVFCKPS